jgi:hypothetical protein
MVLVEEDLEDEVGAATLPGEGAHVFDVDRRGREQLRLNAR